MQTKAQPLPLHYCGSQNNFLELPPMQNGSPAPYAPRNTQQAHQAESPQANVAGMIMTCCGAPHTSQDKAGHATPDLTPNPHHSFLSISLHRAQ